VIDFITEGPYEVGTTVELKAIFQDRNGNNVDPENVTLKIVEPDGTETNLDKTQLNNPSVGEYTYNFTIGQAGKHKYKFTGSTTNPASSEARVGEFMAVDSL